MTGVQHYFVITLSTSKAFHGVNMELQQNLQHQYVCNSENTENEVKKQSPIIRFH